MNASNCGVIGRRLRANGDAGVCHVATLVRQSMRWWRPTLLMARGFKRRCMSRAEGLRLHGSASQAPYLRSFTTIRFGPRTTLCFAHGNDSGKLSMANI
jgi:hypothetical protein